MRIHPRSCVAAGCVVAGFLLAEVGYRALIIPRLSQWHALPLTYYPVELAPMAGGVLAAGVVVRTWRQVAEVAIISAILSLAPLLFRWGRDYDALQTLFINPPAYFTLIGVPIAAIYAARNWMHRRAAT